MPHHNVILNLPGFTVVKVSGPNPIVIHAKYHRKPRCPKCNNVKLRKKDSFFRQVKHGLYPNKGGALT